MRKATLILALLLTAGTAHSALLTGQTPGSYSVPSGWSLVRATDFEGTKPSDETWAIWQGSVQTDRYHGGAKSLGGTYSADQNDIHWGLSTGTIGTFAEAYLSFYEWIDSNALFNDEFFLARFAVSDPFQEILADWYWAPGFNKPNATLYVVPQGVRTWRGGAKGATVPKGAWHQWEIHYRPNTSGASNGFYRVYLDGTLFTSVENANLNGTRSMTGMNIHVGGVYTKLVWMTNSPTCTVCSGAPGSGTDYCTGSQHWSGQPFSAPICRSAAYGGAYDGVDNPLPSFKRYLDDIIVMKYTDGGGGYDSQPPYITSYSPAKSATGILKTNRTISFHIKDDRTDDTGVVTTSPATVTIEGTPYTCAAGLSCTGTTADKTITFTNGSDWAYDQVVNVSISGFKDVAGNVTSTDTYSYTIQADPSPALAITTTTMAGGTVGTAYSGSALASTGGTSPYTYAVTAGTYPPGMVLSSGGTPSGTPTTAGTYNFTVTATDAASDTDDQALSIVVAPLTPGGQQVEQNSNFADTFINSGSPTVNYGDNAALRVYQWGTNTVANRIYLMDNVDIQSIPDNVAITSATLRLYLYDWDGSGGTSPMPVSAYRITSNVPDTATVTWASDTSVLGPVETVTDVPATVGWYEWSVLEAVQAAYAARQPLWLALDGGSQSVANTNRAFYSVDHTDEALWPNLTITYTNLVGPQGPSISTPGKMRISRGKLKKFH